MFNKLEMTLKNSLEVLSSKEEKIHLYNESIFRQIFIDQLYESGKIDHERFEIEWNSFDLIIKPEPNSNNGTLIEFKYYQHSKSERYLNGKWFSKGGPSKKNESEFEKNIEKIYNIEKVKPKNPEYKKTISKIDKAFIVVVCKESFSETQGKVCSYSNSYDKFEPFKDDYRIKQFTNKSLEKKINDTLKGIESRFFGKIIEVKLNKK